MTSVTGGIGDSTLYSANRRRTVVALLDRRLLLNPKFFRNGIVMLVLVVGTAALLFTWIQSTTERADRRLLRVPRPTSARATSSRSSSRATP